MKKQDSSTYPPQGMDRSEVEYHGPKSLRIESYVLGDRQEESVWLVSSRRKQRLSTPRLVKDNPFTLDRFAVGTNQDFIFGARKVASGESDMFLWVRHGSEYKLLPETVNHWIVRRHGKPRGRNEITFVRLLEWRSGGNVVALACNFDDDRRGPWQHVEIDLVRGRFSPYKTLPEGWKSIL